MSRQAATAPAPPACSGIDTRRLLALSASAVVVLAAEPLYLLVDTAVVGHLGAVPLGGLAVAAALMALVSLVGTFVEYGTTARSARWFGAGRTAEAVGEGVQASWLAVLLGSAGVLIGELFAGPFTRLLAGDGPTQQAAESWLRIGVCGLPGILLVLAGNGWMRGVQRSREPVVLVLAANAVSAVLCPLLVHAAGLGLQGSAVANLAGQAVGAALFVRSLARAADRRLRPHRAVMAAQLVVGRDLLIRSIAFQVAFLSAAAVAARMGAAQLGAHQIGLQLWEFTALLLDAFAIGAQSLVGAALGGSDAVAARALAWQVARWGAAAGAALAGLIGAGWTIIPQAFSSDAAVIDQAHLVWPWFVGMLPVAGVVFALDGVLIGAGDVRFMALLTVVAGVVVFAPINVAAGALHLGLGGVWAGLTAFVAARFIGMVLRVRGTRWLVLGATR